MSTSIDLFSPRANPSEMVVGCSPRSISRSAFSRNAPARMTTEVVPSPASTSWALDVWISRLAVGCITERFFRMVAPSFVMMTSPLAVSSSLSMPLGPRLVLMIMEMLLAALMLDIRTSSVFSDRFIVSPFMVFFWPSDIYRGAI